MLSLISWQVNCGPRFWVYNSSWTPRCDLLQLITYSTKARKVTHIFHIALVSCKLIDAVSGAITSLGVVAPALNQWSVRSSNIYKLSFSSRFSFIFPLPFQLHSFAHRSSCSCSSLVPCSSILAFTSTRCIPLTFIFLQIVVFFNAGYGHPISVGVSFLST